jgi:predicted TIM-barrel fold metal-dependent hydrolase
MGFGHPVYRPILRAAAEMSLPIVIQANSDTAATLLTPPVAGGLATTFAEYKSHIAQASMSHLSGMVLSGVFSEMPDLQVLVVGCGATWIPSYLWRYDYYYKIEAHEAPWLVDLPSEYFRRHVRVATYPLESADEPRRILNALATVPWLDSVLMYASGYPSYDWQEPDALRERIPAAWHQRVFHDNARDFFRWPDRAQQAASGDQRETARGGPYPAMREV